MFLAGVNARRNGRGVRQRESIKRVTSIDNGDPLSDVRLVSAWPGSNARIVTLRQLEFAVRARSVRDAVCFWGACIIPLSSSPAGDVYHPSAFAAAITATAFPVRATPFPSSSIFANARRSRVSSERLEIFDAGPAINVVRFTRYFFSLFPNRFLRGDS